jgi:hypothetical protein
VTIVACTVHRARLHVSVCLLGAWVLLQLVQGLHGSACLPGACALQKLVQGLHGSPCLPGACALQYLVQGLLHATYSTSVVTLCESLPSVSCNDCVLNHELCVHMRAGAR